MRRVLALPALLLLAPATGQAACTVSASGVVFGVYSPTSGGATDITGTVTLTCTAGSDTATTYSFAAGAGGGGSFAARRMSGGAGNLPYQLYIDAAHTQVWGDGTAGTSVIPSSPDTIVTKGGSASYTVYGRIAADAAISPGGYSDSIVVTAGY